MQLHRRPMLVPHMSDSPQCLPLSLSKQKYIGQKGNLWAYLCSQNFDLGRDAGEAQSISVTHSGHWSWFARHQQEGLLDSPLWQGP